MWRPAVVLGNGASDLLHSSPRARLPHHGEAAYAQGHPRRLNRVQQRGIGAQTNAEQANAARPLSSGRTERNDGTNARNPRGAAYSIVRRAK